MAVVLGALSAVTVVLQAVALASIISRALLGHQDLGRLGDQFALLIGAYVLRALIMWASELVAHHTALRVTIALRARLLRHVLDLGPGWLTGQRAGELSVTATRGVEAIDSYFARYLPQAILAALAPLGILVWIGAIDWISMLLLAGLVALVPITMIYFGKEATKRSARQWRRLSSLSARLLELVQGLPTLRAFDRAGDGRREVKEAGEALRQSTMTTLRVSFLSALSMELISGLGVGLVAMVLGLRLLGGSLGLATALAILLVSPEIFLPLRRAGAEFHASTEGQAAAARILDVLDREPLTSAGTAEGSEPRGGARDIEVRSLTVRYPGRADSALETVTLRVDDGEHVALDRTFGRRQVDTAVRPAWVRATE